MRAVRISGSRNTVYGDKQHQSCIYQQLYSLPGTSYAFPDTTQLSGNILPPLIAGRLLFFFTEKKQSVSNHSTTYKKPASGSQINFKIIDAGIMNGFETLTRLGGYIMLFSMISSMFRLLPLPETTKLMLTGLTEITNGIKAASQSPLTPACRYLLAMTFTAFGGCSGLAQTSSMIKGTGLSIKKYGIFKLLMTLITAVLAWSVVTLVYPSAFLPVCLP